MPAKLVNALAEWQVSQAAVVGMWVAPGVTMLIPAKLLPVAWQVAQAVMIPSWFIAAPVKSLNFAAGWQLSQPAVNGMCPADGVTIVTPKKLLPVAWQVAQPLLIPVWFIGAPAKLVNALAEWQLSQAAVVGTCVAGVPFAVAPLWHVAQVRGAMPAWLKPAGCQATVT